MPERVVEYSGDSAFVYLLTAEKPQKFERTPITTGITDGINVELKNSDLSKESKLRGYQNN